MKNETIKIKYFLYARKSSESEDRQVQSISDQIDKLKELAEYLNLEVLEILFESKSAHKPNCRPVFETMLERIEKGEAQGVLCWQFNRLSRNPIDSGRLSWMLQQGKIKSIRMFDKEYTPNDNVLLLNIDSGTANQFIIDLSKNTKRGMEGKAKRGWLPTHPPIGYLNDKVEKIIIEDVERYHLVRKMWDLMLTGAYTPPQILNIASKDWGLRTPICGRMGGKEITKSGMYRIFGNIFYTGLFNFAGKQYEGNHKAMITLEEFERVQKLLGKPGRPRPKEHQHAYTGIIHCEECGAMHTASTKIKLIKSTGERKSFTYYYCTHHKKGVTCTQNKTLTEEQLEKQIENYLEISEIHPKFLEWALDYLRNRNELEVEERSKIYKSQQDTYSKTQFQLDNLTKMRYRELIDDEQFLKERNELKSQLSQLKQEIENTEGRAVKWLELTQQTFEFVTYARTHFKNPKITLEEKKAIFLGLGWNHSIKDRILNISKYKWLETIENEYKPLKNEYDALELDKTLEEARRIGQMETIRTRWGAYWDLNPD